MPPGDHPDGPPVPRELRAVVVQPMAREPAARYASVPALMEDVRAYLDGRTLAAAHYTVGRQLDK